MPPKKNNNATPIKPPEGFTTTHEEEEWHYDLSNLKGQVLELVNSQRANEAKLEANMKAQEKRMMEVMEGLKGALTAEITE